jgi:pilus assembly protein FimV
VAEEEVAAEPLTMDAPDLVNTIVNPMALGADDVDFDVKLSDSVFLGQPMMPSEFDIGSINLDLSAEPSPVATPSDDLPEPVGLPEAAVESEAVAAEVVRDAQWEEVNTKLDLAKAYEEMGDLEGARELLQEVLGEGSADLVEQAQAILGRIGG